MVDETIHSGLSPIVIGPVPIDVTEKAIQVGRPFNRFEILGEAFPKLSK
jgi:hypothetical protein